jgi:hypothetical protein
MSLIIAAAFSGWLNVWPFPPPQQTTRVIREPTWYVSVRRDRFTGGLECRLFQGQRKHPLVAYARKSLSFRFATHLNTLEAAYRVDAGPVVSWNAIYPALISQGVTLPAVSMDNPTDGQVILPMSVLAGGHAVTIRPTSRSRPQAFYLDGLGDALANATARGCAPDAFVR